MHGECCICEISSTFDESNVLKKHRQLPLIGRPEVLFLPFQNTYKTICRRCTDKNNQLIAHYKTTSLNFQPIDFLNCIRNGDNDKAKLICSMLPIGECVHYHDPTTGETALHLCAKNGYWHMARFLLERRRKRTQDPTSAATDTTDFDDLAENQVQNRRTITNAEDLELLDATDIYNKTCLHVVCTINYRADLCLLFCQRGSNLNAYVNDATPLMLACACGNVKMIDILYKHGAFLNMRSKNDGKTCLMKAALLGERKGVERLIQLGASVEYVDHAGVNAYEMALKRECLDVNYGEIAAVLKVQFEKLGLVAGAHEGSKSISKASSSSSSTTSSKKSSSSKYGYHARMQRKQLMAWKEHWDDLSESPYWWNILTDETTFDCPIGVDPSYINPLVEKEKQIFQQEQEEQEQEQEDVAAVKTLLPYLIVSPQQRKKARELKLLQAMKEEYREYYQSAQTIVAEMSPPVQQQQQQQQSPSKFYQSLPDRTVRVRPKQQPPPSVVRPMNPPLFYHNEQMMADKYLPSLYKSFEDPGIDFPLQNISTDPAKEALEEQHHVWPGNYKRSGMGGDVGLIGELVEEEEGDDVIQEAPLNATRGRPRAQEARDWFQVSRRKEKLSSPGSYALYTNEKS